MDTEDSILISENLFHYTTQKGLFGIIRDEVIWATDILYLNDAAEFRYTFDLIQEEIDSLKRSASKDDIPLFEHIDDMADSRLRAVNSPFFRTFVCSFSEERDQLSQWRGYSNSEGGFSIGFNFAKIKTLIRQQGFEIKKCVYELDQQVQTIQDTIQKLLGLFREKQNDSSFWSFGNSLRSKIFSEAFLPLASIFKHPKFYEENEWRLISPKIIYDDEKIYYREGRSMIIPYMHIKLTNEENSLPFSEVVTGPTPHPDLSNSSVESFLHSKNIKCDVNNSEIPYRNM